MLILLEFFLLYFFSNSFFNISRNFIIFDGKKYFLKFNFTIFILSYDYYIRILKFLFSYIKIIVL